MSLFNNKLSKVPLGMLDQDVQDKFTGYDTSLAHITTKAIKIKTQGVKENDDITSLLNSLFFNGNTEVDLMGYNFTVSNIVTMTNSCVLKNGTLTLTGTGKIIITGQYSTIKYINFIGNNITSSSNKDGAVIVRNSHNRLYRLKFDSVITAIVVGQDNVTGFFDVNMSFIAINSCTTGFYIYADVVNSWMSGINIDNVMITFKQFGMVFTRGDITNKNMRQQLSHCNVSNITFIDVHDTTEATGLFINVGWNNFNNLNFFNDGSASYPFHAIRFDQSIDTSTTNNTNLTLWDVIYGFRSNNFSNLFVEGDLILNGQYHLNKFKNLKLSYNNASKTTTNGGTFIGAPSNTNGFVSYDSNIIPIQSMNSNSNLSIVAPTVAQVTMTKTNGVYNITNTLATASPAYINLTLDDVVRQKAASSIASQLMVTTLCQDGATSIVNGTYQYKLTNQSNTTITGADYSTTDGIILNKGQIGIGVFELLQVNKSTISSATTLNVVIRILVPANTTVILSDFRIYPYMVTALNDDNVAWHNDYMN